MKLLRKMAVTLAPFLPSPLRFPLLSLPAGILTGDLSVSVTGYSVKRGPGGAVHHIPSGIAWTRGAHLDEHGRLLNDLSPGMNRNMEYWLRERGVFLPRLQHLEHEVVSLIADGHDNYYHWLYDVLPKLAAFDFSTLSSLRFLACTKHPFHLQTLELLGISRCSVISALRLNFYRSPLLQVPVAPTGPILESILFLRKYLVDNPAQPLPQSPAGPRFYISRSNASSRRLNNETELLKLLTPLGFQVVTTENLTAAQQISLFHHAEIIISVTGAALANLAFCRPGTRLLILMPQNCEDFLYRDLALTTGLDPVLQSILLVPDSDADPVKSNLVLDEARLACIRSTVLSWVQTN